MTPNYELLRQAAAIIEGIPNKMFKLDSLLRDNAAEEAIGDAPMPKPYDRYRGTVGCVIGWLSLHPQFKAEGLTTQRNPLWGHLDLMWKGREAAYHFAGAELFGITVAEARNLFGCSGTSFYDYAIPYTTSSKVRFRLRLTRFLLSKGQPVNPNYTTGKKAR